MPALHTARIFIEISPTIAQSSELYRQLCRFKQTTPSPTLFWIPQENWHITLKFLGHTSVEKIPQLTEALKEELSRHPSFDLRLTHFTWFPSIKKPSILAIIPEPCEPLVRLATALNETLTPYGFAPEAKTFRPHLSLARTRARKASHRNEQLLTDIKPIVMHVDKIHLTQSKPKKPTVYYSKLATFPLLS